MHINLNFRDTENTFFECPKYCMGSIQSKENMVWLHFKQAGPLLWYLTTLMGLECGWRTLPFRGSQGFAVDIGWLCLHSYVWMTLKCKKRGHVDCTLVFTGEFFKATAFKTHYLAEPVAGGKNSVDMFTEGHSTTVPWEKRTWDPQQITGNISWNESWVWIEKVLTNVSL